MKSAFILRAVLVCVLGTSVTAQAANTHLSTGLVDIDYDQDTFAFSRETASFGGFITEDILPSSVTVSAAGNGVELNFNSQMSLYATSYTNFSPESLTANFSALFNFAPTAGYIITGYTVTYAGTYSIETPGTVGLNGPGVWQGENSGAGAFSWSGAIAGAVAPSITGVITATGDINILQVFDHNEEVFDHYEQVLDYCEVENPEICYYHDEPVYNYVPVYRDETDLGEAQIQLNTITVQAHVAAVPEPQGLLLLALGAPVAAWMVRRRRI